MRDKLPDPARQVPGSSGTGNITEAIRPHYYDAGSHDLIGHWLATGHYAAIFGPIQKYVERAGRKSSNPLDDLYKAREYLSRWIEFLENEGCSKRDEVGGNPSTDERVDFIIEGQCASD